MKYQVYFIAKRWENHSTHSGYEQLGHLLGSNVPSLDLDSVWDKWIPGRIAVRLASQSGVNDYSYLAFYDEWSAVRYAFGKKRNAIFHILYADDSYRYLGDWSRFSRAKTVATYHLPPESIQRNLHYTGHLRRLDAVIVVGTNQVEFFQSIVGPSKVFWVPHGVNTTVFCPSPRLEAHSSAKRLCLFVGMHRRDFGTLRRVIELVGLQDKHVNFALVTAKCNWHQFTGLDSVSLQSGITEPELVNLYQNADLLVEPLEDCTANNAILEGLACGLPTIATDVGAVHDYLDEGCGVLTPPRDAELMATAVIDLLRDETKRRQMALNARAHALRYDWSVIATRTNQVYAQILG